MKRGAAACVTQLVFIRPTIRQTVLGASLGESDPIPYVVVGEAGGRSPAMTPTWKKENFSPGAAKFPTWVTVARAALLSLFIIARNERRKNRERDARFSYSRCFNSPFPFLSRSFVRRHPSQRLTTRTICRPVAFVSTRVIAFTNTRKHFDLALARLGKCPTNFQALSTVYVRYLKNGCVRVGVPERVTFMMASYNRMRINRHG